MPEELFEKILSGNDFVLERIVSRGHVTPAGTWCEQKLDEWVIVLKGSAGILFEGDNEILSLKAGDYMLIPAKLRHRVEWTDDEGETVWLALHLGGMTGVGGK